MAPVQAQHHHHSSTKTTHKAFKSRHATKNLLRNQAKGKLEKPAKGTRRTPHQQVMSKLDRKNQARQQRQAKHAANASVASVFSGKHAAPRIVALVSLSSDVNLDEAVESLTAAVGAHRSTEASCRVRFERFKQSVQVLFAGDDLMSTLDACRVADYVVFVFSSNQEPDEQTDILLRTIESQGVSSVLTIVQNLHSIDSAKKQAQALASFKSYIIRFFPDQEKLLSLDNPSECANTIRSLCSGMPKSIGWRDIRSWMLVEDVRWANDATSSDGHVILTGHVRGKGLKVDRLVQVGDWGQYQIKKISRDPVSKNPVSESMAVDEEGASEEVLQTPGHDQEENLELAPLEVAMGTQDESITPGSNIERRGVLLDDHHYFSEDETHIPEAPIRVPKGTSQYQSAWFLGDMSDSGSDYEETVDKDGDIAMSTTALPQDGVEGLDRQHYHDPTEATPSEYPQSEMFLDPSPDEEAAQLADYRAQRKNAADEDLEFPDEIELHPNVLARERLARYRGLKSLRTSTWDEAEDKAFQPENWSRLLQVPDYKRSKTHAVNDALADGIESGNRVRIYLRNVPPSLRATYDPRKPLALFSLLKHEQKRTVVNMGITLRSDQTEPLKSKSKLIVQCGARRFAIHPLFSQLGNTPNDVHKYLRYLHPGQTAIATFIAPVTWGPVPVLFFQPPPPSSSQTSLSTPIDLGMNLIGTGTNFPSSTSRVIAKRVILTGHPYKIHKRLVTVRYMFFNAEDVRWFKALPLWTKRGRSGFIKESLGTHGYFKATFDAKINPQDAVGVSLYKRMWPRQAVAWKPGA